MTDTSIQKKQREITADRDREEQSVRGRDLNGDASEIAKTLAERSAGLLGLCQILKEKKIGYKQFFLLEFLIESGETTMTEIASTMSMKTAAVTGMIDRLSNRSLGYVQRYDCPNDRRKRLVRITEKGERAVMEIRGMMQELFTGLLAAEFEGREEELEPVYANLRELADS